MQQRHNASRLLTWQRHLFRSHTQSLARTGEEIVGSRKRDSISLLDDPISPATGVLLFSIPNRPRQTVERLLWFPNPWKKFYLDRLLKPTNSPGSPLLSDDYETFRKDLPCLQSMKKEGIRRAYRMVLENNDQTYQQTLQSQ